MGLCEKIGKPSLKDIKQAQVYVTSFISDAAKETDPLYRVVHGRLVRYVRRPSHLGLIDLEAGINQLMRVISRLQSHIVTALNDPLVLRTVNEGEEKTPSAFMNKGAHASVAVRPAFSFGYAMGLENIKKDSDIDSFMEVTKRAALDLKSFERLFEAPDKNEQHEIIQRRSRLWDTIVRMARAHAHHRRSIEDRHAILDSVLELRQAISALQRAEHDYVRLKMTKKKGFTTLQPFVERLSKAAQTTIKLIHQIYAKDSRTLVKTEKSLWADREQEGVNINFDPNTKQIKTASLNCLIMRLTHEKRVDVALQKAFLAAYVNFCTPHHLFSKLVERYQVPTDVNARDGLNRNRYFTEVVKPIQLRVFNFLRVWLDNNFGDFDHVLLRDLNDFVENRMMTDGNLKFAKQLTTRIKNQISKVQEKMIATDGPLAASHPDANRFLLELDDQVFAEQVTIRFFKIYKRIEPTELLGLAWSKEKLRHRAPNIVQMIAEFNKYSSWVQTRILSLPGLRDRSRVYGKFVRIALLLWELKNFDTLIDMIAVFNSAAIRRLAFTREAAGAKIVTDYERIRDQVSAGRNHSAYREIVHTARPPLLPYLGVYLTDMTFIDEGNVDFVGGLINFGKVNFIYAVLAEIAQYQQDPFPFNADPNIQAAFDQATYQESSDALFQLSIKVEPRNANKADLVQ